jgi:carotenoid cleavage dioxygenase
MPASTALPITTRHGKALSREGLRPSDAPAWIDDIDNPYLHGLFAPVTRESTFDDLPVVGELPRDLNGAYFRNGPNSRFAPLNRYHWFDGDGMVHGLWFQDGTARYRSRWIQTRGLTHEAEVGSSVWPGVLGPFDFSLPGGPLKDTANTDLIAWQGELLALWYESGKLVQLDPSDLHTVGIAAIQAQIGKRISAHSKVDPATGELVFFGYGDRPPYMHYGVVKPDGTVHATDITLPGPRRPHDLGVTPQYSILHDFPMFFDPEHFKKTGKRVPLFHPEVPTRYGVLPRHGTDADVRWFEFEPCYMLHVVNCWEEGDEVVMVGCRTDDPSLKPDPADGKIAAMLSGIKLQANLYEWRMNLATGATSERRLDDRNAEFPMIAPSWMGRRNRYAYLQEIPYEIPATFDALVKVDLHTGETQRYAYGPGVFGSEAPFAPRDGAGDDEDDGYVITFVTDTSDWSSACWVFDARHIEAGPVCRIPIPHRIPAGFHATWMSGAELG